MGFWTTFGFKKHKMGSHFIGNTLYIAPNSIYDVAHPEVILTGRRKRMKLLRKYGANIWRFEG